MEMLEVQTPAYVEGYAAFKRGAREQENPKKLPHDRQEWFNGFDDAAYDDLQQPHDGDL